MQLARWRAVTVIIGSWSPPTAISAVTTVITSAGGAGEVRGLARERQPRQGGLRVEAEPLLHRGALVRIEAASPAAISASTRSASPAMCWRACPACPWPLASRASAIKPAAALEDLGCSPDDAPQRIVHDEHGDAGCRLDPVCQPRQQGPAPGETDLSPHHVLGKVRRDIWEDLLHRADDRRDGVLERLGH